MAAHITGPKSLLFPKLPDGTANPLWELINYADVVGVPVKVLGDVGSVGPMEDYSILTLDTVAGVVALGCDVAGYPAWIEVDPKAACPDYIDDNRVPDDGETLDPLTWEEWLNPTHSVTLDKYVPTDGAGEHLAGSILGKLIADGYTIKNLPEMQAIIAASAPDEL